MSNLLLGIGLMTLGISQILLWILFLVRTSELREVNELALECKSDALKLESRINVIAPNQLINGKRPVPIRPRGE